MEKKRIKTELMMMMMKGYYLEMKLTRVQNRLTGIIDSRNFVRFFSIFA